MMFVNKETVGILWLVRPTEGRQSRSRDQCWNIPLRLLPKIWINTWTEWTEWTEWYSAQFELNFKMECGQSPPCGVSVGLYPRSVIRRILDKCCGSPSQLPEAQVTNWCSNWMCIAHYNTNCSAPSHNKRLSPSQSGGQGPSLIEDITQRSDTNRWIALDNLVILN